MGDKLFPLWLELVGEKNVFGQLKPAWKSWTLIDSAEIWLQRCGLRNKMVHEYIESPELLADSLNQAAEHVTSLQSSMDRVLLDLDSRISGVSTLSRTGCLAEFKK